MPRISSRRYSRRYRKHSRRNRSHRRSHHSHKRRSKRSRSSGHYIRRKGYLRHSYRRKSGSRVKATYVPGSLIKSRGRRRHGRSPQYGWIKHKGKLGGPGFIRKKLLTQHRLLTKCVRRHGYKSCLGSVMVLERSTPIKRLHGKRLASLRHYLTDKYGK